MTLLDYILLSLATYRLATDLAWEDGPYEIFAWVRGQALVRYGPEHWVTSGVSCPICLAFWLAPVVLGLRAWVPWLVVWLAIAGAAALLARVRQ